MMTSVIAALLVGQCGVLSAAVAGAEEPSVGLHEGDAAATRTKSPPVFEWNFERAIALSEFTEPEPFGRRGSRRWQIQGAFAFEPPRARNTLTQLGLGVSYFVVDNLSFDAELNALFISQRRDDALAGNLNLFFRWHFLPENTWSMYLDAGAGMLLASKRVPHDGSRFNFTPQLGGGMSFELVGDVRLMTGLRWHHISNANLYSDNPGRDSIMAYVGLSFGY